MTNQRAADKYHNAAANEQYRFSTYSGKDSQNTKNAQYQTDECIPLADTDLQAGFVLLLTAKQTGITFIHQKADTEGQDCRDDNGNRTHGISPLKMGSGPEHLIHRNVKFLSIQMLQYLKIIA